MKDNKEMEVEVKIEKPGKEMKDDGMAPIKDAMKSIMDSIEAGEYSNIGMAIDAAMESLKALKEDTKSLGGLGDDSGMNIDAMVPEDEEEYA